MTISRSLPDDSKARICFRQVATSMGKHKDKLSDALPMDMQFTMRGRDDMIAARVPSIASSQASPQSAPISPAATWTVPGLGGIAPMMPPMSLR